MSFEARPFCASGDITQKIHLRCTGRETTKRKSAKRRVQFIIVICADRINLIFSAYCAPFRTGDSRCREAVANKKNSCGKNKTHKKLIEKLLFGIRLSVTKVKAIETNKGIGERSREVLGESKGRAVCTCYDALS